MTVYLCAYATRIQTWLARTPQLKLLRGASQALRVHTDPSHVKAWLDQGEGANGIVLDAKAGNVDGVVVLNAPSLAAAERAAVPLLRHLQGSVPGVPWSAWIHQSDSYLRSFEAAERGAEEVRRFSVLAPVQELGFAHSCDSCRAEVAVGDAVHPHADGPEGVDCRARRAESTPDRTWDAIPGDWPDDFDALARTGGLTGPGPEEPGTIERPSPKVTTEALGRRDSRNHLATIVADGNRIGSLFSRLARAEPPQDGLREAAVRTLNQAVHEAVEIAAQACSDPGTGVKVAIPHYVGGDDVLVSVPAPRAWTFAATLAEEFETRFRNMLLRDLVRADGVDQGLLDDIAGVSLGVGIVFAHASHPFADSQELGHRAMKAAKRFSRGRASAIGWVDLTAGDSRTDIHVIAARDAARQLQDPKQAPGLFRLGASARQQVSLLVRNVPLVDGRRDPHLVESALASWSDRTKRTTRLSARDAAADVSRSRWWPGLPKDDPEERTSGATA
jgi:hypothetical protein